MPELLIRTQPLARQPRSRRDVGLVYRRTQATTITPSIDRNHRKMMWQEGRSRDFSRNKCISHFPPAVTFSVTGRFFMWRSDDPTSSEGQVGTKGVAEYELPTRILLPCPVQLCPPTAVLPVFPEVYSQCEYSLCIQSHGEVPTPRSAVKRREPDIQCGGDQVKKVSPHMASSSCRGGVARASPRINALHITPYNGESPWNTSKMTRIRTGRCHTRRVHRAEGELQGPCPALMHFAPPRTRMNHRRSYITGFVQLALHAHLPLHVHLMASGGGAAAVVPR